MSDPRDYLLNDFEDAVQENLLGLVLANNHLRLIKDTTIVVRADLEDEVLAKRKVCLISGGGSGHEPSHAGFIGPGLLTASVSGHIFASPSADQVYQAIQYLESRKIQNEGGTLLIVPNYTGDRLNFGLAKERAFMNEIKTEVFIFGDDVAFDGSSSSTGPRGLAGVFFVHKCAGALADRNFDLTCLKNKLVDFSGRIGSISVSLTPCNIPGKGSSFKMPPRHFELGLGIHGERGLQRETLKPTKNVVQSMLNCLFGAKSRLNPYLSKGQNSFALLFNDNGGLTTIEMNVVIKETLLQCKAQAIDVKRVFTGRYVTSFDMIGVCISAMAVNDEILSLLDSQCSTPIISIGNTLQNRPNALSNAFVHHVLKDDEYLKKTQQFLMDSSIFEDCLRAACQALIENKDLLNDLDGEDGDSDCGSGLERGAKAILEAISLNKTQLSFASLSKIVEDSMGGTSGAVYSLLLRSAAKTAKNEWKKQGLTIQFWANVLKQAIDNVCSYSCAKPGDRTLIDPLHSLSQFLQNPQTSGQKAVLEEAIKVVENSTNATADMIPKVGRASYSGRRINRPDPGAYSVLLWSKAIFSVLLRKC